MGANNWNSIYATLSDIASFGSTVLITLTDQSKTATIYKTEGANAWSGSARGSVGYNAPCTIEFNKTASASDDGNSYAMIGWNEDPTTNDSYTSLDYAAYPYQTNSYSYYHNGEGGTVSTSWSTALKFYIVYTTDGYIKHYNGSTLLYTSPLYGTNKTVYFDTSVYSANSGNGSFSNVKIARRAWNGTSYIA